MISSVNREGSKRGSLSWKSRARVVDVAKEREEEGLPEGSMCLYI